MDDQVEFDEENPEHLKLLRTVCQNLADVARKENFPKGLPIYYMNDKKELIEEWADGRKIVVEKLNVPDWIKVDEKYRNIRLD